MEIPTYLLFALGCLGAADIALFHAVAHGIRSHPDSAAELLTHSLRGPTYAALFLLIPNFEMHGLFAWSLLALFVIDMGISIWDFSLEQRSRRFLGGLPSGEYVLHMLMAIVFGGLVASFMFGANTWFSKPTLLVYKPSGAGIILRLALSIMAVAVLVSGIQDAAAALQLRKLGRAGRFQLLSAESVERMRTADPVGARGPRSLVWMRLVLCAAGLYNLFWGAWVVCFPDDLFHWVGAPVPNYPQIWQCVGMIVGVYGVGYLIAAQDPFRHWPMVLVGLLGKALGPIGMWWSVARGGLPVGLGWVCVLNDLIWWAPFAVILWRSLISFEPPSVDNPVKVA